MMRESKQRLLTLLKIGVIVGSIGVLYYFFVRISGLRIPCVLYSLTGLKCPGCGLTRMCVSLLQLDFTKAYRYHPIMFCALVPLSICVGAQAYRYVKTGTKEWIGWQKWVVGIIAAALLAFTIYRNIKI